MGPISKQAKQIVAIVAAECKIDLAFFTGHGSRTPSMVEARHIAMHLLRIHCKEMGLRDISLACGRKDHTTTLVALRKMATRILSDEEFAKRVRAIDAKVMESLP